MSPLLTMQPREMLERVAPDLIRPLHQVKREAIESAMILCQGDVHEAARRLDISPRTLYRLLRQWRKADA